MKGERVAAGSAPVTYDKAYSTVIVAKYEGGRCQSTKMGFWTAGCPELRREGYTSLIGLLPLASK
jgi:hypothetical protein